MTTQTTPPYLKSIEQRFKQAEDPARAEKMKAYMKGQYAYYGIMAPIRKQLIQEHKNEKGLLPEEQKTKLINWCWDQPQREWQYFAMEMLGRTAKKANLEIISSYEFMIVTKSWWDTIDYVASNLLGPYFKKFPEQIPIATTKWMASQNIWLQRSCLLFQLKYKQNLNTELLETFIPQLLDSKEFFIRKAVGWILREYSKTNPDYVIAFVNDHKLSGLSEREALKWLNRK